MTTSDEDRLLERWKITRDPHREGARLREQHPPHWFMKAILGRPNLGALRPVKVLEKNGKLLESFMARSRALMLGVKDRERGRQIALAMVRLMTATPKKPKGVGNPDDLPLERLSESRSSRENKRLSDGAFLEDPQRGQRQRGRGVARLAPRTQREAQPLLAPGLSQRAIITP